MQSNALVAGQDASGSHADMTASAMEMVGGQLGCAGHMQPLQAPLDTQPTLIEVDDRVSDELCADAFPSRLGAADKLTAGRERLAVPVTTIILPLRSKLTSLDTIVSSQEG